MKFFSLILTLACAPAALAVDNGGIQVRRSNAAVTVMVDDQEKAVDLLVKEAESRGGYFKERSSLGVVARIPVTQLDGYLKVVAGLGTVAEKRLTNADVAEKRTQLAAAVASREEMLKRYMASMDQAKDREDFQTIQAASGELIAEIERAKGALRVLDNDARFAEVDVAFKLRDRTPVRLSHDNKFAWLSTVDLNGLLSEFAATGENR